MKTALLCSGQGSQYVGMLKDIYSANPKAKEMIDKADEILGFKISEICFEGPIETLKETRYTQPALFLHSAVAYALTKENLEFNAVAGHSVGEYAALYAADVLSFEDALKLVALRGKLMFSAGEDEPGTMFAVINMDDDKVVEVCADLTSKGNGNKVVAANFNSPGQVVVSGSREYLRENAEAFKEAGARMVKELVVSGAFHSPLMEAAQSELESAINDIEFNDAKVPVYTNVDAKPVTSGAALKTSLIQQLTSPVLWTQTLNEMNANSINNFIEIGAGNVLQGLVKRSLKDVSFSGDDKLEDIEKIVS